MSRKINDYITLIFKGIGMGAADVVPGVSGGTIAFITGIYQELIDSIKSVNLSAMKCLFRDGFRKFWKTINGGFLISVFAGILISVFSLAKLFKYLLDNHPVFVWSFFFGLILFSAYYVSKEIKRWNIAVIIALLAGAVFAYFVTELTPTETTNAKWFLFISGAVAICAMILPGISGSFILLILGKYKYILKAVSELNFVDLAIFGAGAVIGLMVFSNILSWLLKKFYQQTVAILTGFMIGSLNKVWPWKITVKEIVDKHGELKPVIQDNVFPEHLSAETFYAFLFALSGAMIIIVFEFIAKKMQQTKINQ